MSTKTAAKTALKGIGILTILALADAIGRAIIKRAQDRTSTLVLLRSGTQREQRRDQEPLAITRQPGTEIESLDHFQQTYGEKPDPRSLMEHIEKTRRRAPYSAMDPNSSSL